MLINGCQIDIVYAFDRKTINNPNSDKSISTNKERDESKFIIVNTSNYSSNNNNKEVIIVELSKPIDVQLGAYKIAGDKVSPTKSNLGVPNKNGGSKLNLSNISGGNGLNCGGKNGGSKLNLSNIGAVSLNNSNNSNKSTNNGKIQQQNDNEKKIQQQQQQQQQKKNNGLINYTNNGNNQQENGKKKKRERRRNNQPKVESNDDSEVQLYTLKSNPSQPLFAKGPTTEANKFSRSDALKMLDYNSPLFKPTNYLENKPVHTTTTYYTNKPMNNISSVINSSRTPNDSNQNTSNLTANSSIYRSPLLKTPTNAPRFNLQESSVYKKIYASNSNQSTPAAKPKQPFLETPSSINTQQFKQQTQQPRLETSPPSKPNLFRSSSASKIKRDDKKEDNNCIIS